jgi:hypothetical protein
MPGSPVLQGATMLSSRGFCVLWLTLAFGGSACPPREKPGDAGGTAVPDAGGSSSGAVSSSGGARDAGPDFPAGTLGSRCQSAQDCTGVRDALCATMLSAEPVPDGVCVSLTCTVAGPCHDGAGYCVGGGDVTWCVRGCTVAGSCPRDGFSCFQALGVGNVCLPSSHSQCSPRANLGCQPGETCNPAGPDDVGVCIPACSPEHQDCAPLYDGGPARGCYFSDGTPFCSEPLDPQPDYAPCTHTNGCLPGRTCMGLFDVPRCYFACDPDGPEPRCPLGNCQALFQGHLCIPDPPLSDAGVADGG